MTYFTRERQPLIQGMVKKLEGYKTLYVCRPVMNGGEIIKWAKAAGFATTYPSEDMHVTICYSKTPVDWGKADYKPLNIELQPSPWRSLQILGGDTAVLIIGAWELRERHDFLMGIGASWDYDYYEPHISISQNPPVNLDKITPYAGRIILGPEVFSEVVKGAMSDVVEKKDKTKSKYMNKDGTFKNGFDGCVLYMTEHEGHDAESARKICGKIAQSKA